MPPCRDRTASLMTALDQRAARLARLLDSHPARHLLAEYEALLLDRRPCLDRPAVDPETTARRLLEVMDRSIVDLEAIVAAAP
jgi:hypothetical protein